MSDSESFIDPYVYPGTQVLKNIFAETNPAKLTELEYRTSFIRRAELATHPLTGAFNLSRLQETHRLLFQDVYEWAGELRTVDLSKGSSNFHPSGYLVTAARNIFSWLSQSKLLTTGVDDNTFIAQASELLEKINYLHPFREGNGRSQRAFLDQVAAVSGRTLAWRNISKREHTLASIRAFEQNSGKPFRDIFAEILKPPFDGLDPLESSYYQVTGVSQTDMD